MSGAWWHNDKQVQRVLTLIFAVYSLFGAQCVVRVHVRVRVCVGVFACVGACAFHSLLTRLHLSLQRDALKEKVAALETNKKGQQTVKTFLGPVTKL